MGEFLRFIWKRYYFFLAGQAYFSELVLERFYAKIWDGALCAFSCRLWE